MGLDIDSFLDTQTENKSEEIMKLPEKSPEKPIIERKHVDSSTLIKDLRKQISDILSNTSKNLKNKNYEAAYQSLERINRIIDSTPFKIELQIFDLKVKIKNEEEKILKEILNEKEQFATSFLKSCNQIETNIERTNSKELYKQIKQLEKEFYNQNEIIKNQCLNEKKQLAIIESKIYKKLANEKNYIENQKTNEIKELEKQCLLFLKNNELEKSKQTYETLNKKISTNTIFSPERKNEIEKLAESTKNIITQFESVETSLSKIQTQTPRYLIQKKPENKPKEEKNVNLPSKENITPTNIQRKNQPKKKDLRELCRDFYKEPEKKEARIIYSQIKEILQSNSITSTEKEVIKRKLAQSWRRKE